MTSPATTAREYRNTHLLNVALAGFASRAELGKACDLAEQAFVAALAAEREAVLATLATRGWDQAHADMERFYEKENDR